MSHPAAAHAHDAPVVDLRSALRPCGAVEAADGEAADHDHDHDHDHAHGHGHGHGHAHAHGHGHSHHDHARSSSKRLGIALALTAGFMGVEATVGWWSGSLSLLADAGHMLADSGALAMAIAAQRIAARPRTSAQTYGYRRAEVLAAFVNGVVLVAVALGIVFEAVQRLGSVRDVQGHAMSLTAAAGLAINVVAAVVLAGGGKSNVNVRAAMAHVISDALGSASALVAGVLVAYAGLHWADPVASIFIAALVAYGAWKLVRETTHVLMQGTPEGRDAVEVEHVVRGVDGVVDLHDLHLWRVSDGLDVLTVHVVVASGESGTDVAHRVRETLRKKLGITQATVQPEVAVSQPSAVSPQQDEKSGCP